MWWISGTIKCFGREGIWLNFEIIVEDQGMREVLFAWPVQADLSGGIGRKVRFHPELSVEDLKLFDLIVEFKGISEKSIFL